MSMMSTNTADTHNAYWKQILCFIYKELERNLFLAMYQLGMPGLANEVEQYCKELSNSPTTLAPNTSTTSSTPSLLRD